MTVRKRKGSELLKLRVNVVGLVDEPANLKDFAVVKRRKEAAQKDSGGSEMVKKKKGAASSSEGDERIRGLVAGAVMLKQAAVLDQEGVEAVSQALADIMENVGNFTEFLESADMDANGMLVIPEEQVEGIAVASDWLATVKSSLSAGSEESTDEGGSETGEEEDDVSMGMKAKKKKKKLKKKKKAAEESEDEDEDENEEEEEVLDLKALTKHIAEVAATTAAEVAGEVVSEVMKELNLAVPKKKSKQTEFAVEDDEEEEGDFIG